MNNIIDIFKLYILLKPRPHQNKNTAYEPCRDAVKKRDVFGSNINTLYGVIRVEPAVR